MNFSWPKIKSIKKIKPLGNTTPWAWIIEPSFGCNLECGHCCAELIPEQQKMFMSYETWCSTFKILNLVSPTVRVDICGIVGEPTLHPHLTEWLKMARKLAPLIQIQITTNGTMLLKGRVNYRDLLNAGANIIYTDQYGPHRRFEGLARESGYPYYQYYNRPKDAWSPWKFHGPHLKMIVLMEHPGTWPKSRLKSGLLGNWYGHLNWKKAARFNMFPVKRPLTRRCNQPFLYVNVASDGHYLMCCQDGMHTTAGQFGNVSMGVDGFRKFWYGKRMQIVRRNLRAKNRAGMPQSCAKCSVTPSRGDYKHWTENQLKIYWDGTQWLPL